MSQYHYTKYYVIVSCRWLRLLLSRCLLSSLLSPLSPSHSLSLSFFFRSIFVSSLLFLCFSLLPLSPIYCHTTSMIRSGLNSYCAVVVAVIVVVITLVTVTTSFVVMRESGNMIQWKRNETKRKARRIEMITRLDTLHLSVVSTLWGLYLYRKYPNGVSDVCISGHRWFYLWEYFHLFFHVCSRLVLVGTCFCLCLCFFLFCFDFFCFCCLVCRPLPPECHVRANGISRAHRDLQ